MKAARIVRRWTENGHDLARRALCIALCGGLASTGWSMSRQCTPAICGEWEGPQDLGTACDGCGGDEIGHVTLIPTGVHAGRLLFWTACHDPSFPGFCNPYRSRILEISSMPSIIASPEFASAYPTQNTDGPFCAGHNWILDENGDAKFLVVGGVEFGPPRIASRQTFWFDPATSTWQDGPGTLPILEQNSAGDQKGAWYPAVITFFDPSALSLNPYPRTIPRFRAIAIGGTSIPFAACTDDAEYSGWWTMSLGGTWTGVTNTDGHEWEYYPRAQLLHTASGTGEIVSTGIDVACGGTAPCHKIITDAPVQSHQVFPSQPSGVGVWDTNHAVLLHTLVPGWTWDTANPLAQYQLNRVIGTMGSDAGGASATVLAETRELVNGSWIDKADAPVARYFSNGVLLPDGSLLVVGGQNNKEKGGNDVTVYRSTADRFSPGQPTGLGTWSTLASTNLQPGKSFSTPRGYHSVALLLADASVVLMGGRRHDVTDSRYGGSDSEDTVDRFNPPYLSNGARPVLGNVPQAIYYGQTFEVDFSVAVGREAKHLCLMGIGSVTHHQNFGQRYVELMWRTLPPTPPVMSTKKKEVLAPPVVDMAPEGYYMLFGVNDLGVPSFASFVKLTL